MKKNQLIQIHGLFGTIVKNFDVPVEELETYDDLNITPSAIHKSKDAHEEAVFALAEELDGWLEENDVGTTAEEPPIEI